ncbi:MAG: hypothetical protein ABFD60_07050 [Bryobacteraceae bacterium]
MSFSFSFNGVDFSSLGVKVNASGPEWIPAPKFDIITVPGSDVALANASRYQARALKFSGVVIGASFADLTAKMDAIALALNERNDCILSVDAIPGRYWMARLGGPIVAELRRTSAKVDFSFIANDPHAYSTTETDDVQTWPRAAWEITPGGTHEIAPAVIFEATGAATVVVIENSDTDERISWAGTLATGNRLKFDCATWRVWFDQAGLDDWELSQATVSGTFLTLRPGVANNLRLLAPAAGSLRLIYRERYV